MEDVEFLECQEEMNEQVLEQYTLVERVIAARTGDGQSQQEYFASGGDSPTLNVPGRTALREPIVFWNRLTAFCAGTRQKLFLARVQRFTVREGGEGVDNVGALFETSTNGREGEHHHGHKRKLSSDKQARDKRACTSNPQEETFFLRSWWRLGTTYKNALRVTEMVL
eukprot:Em0848g2a